MENATAMADLRAQITRLEEELNSSRVGTFTLPSELRDQLFSQEAWSGIFRETIGSLPFGVEERTAAISAVTVIRLKREFGEPYSAADARVLLKKYGFDPDDVRAAGSGSWDRDFPLLFFSADGDLEMCKWLYGSGAADDVTKTSTHHSFTPMLAACLNGHLPVCKWLFEVGAATEVRNNIMEDNDGPMLLACSNGHLHVMQWLADVAPPELLRTPNQHGLTPMLQACFKGHLSICQWLRDAGAAEDLTIADNNGYTPLFVAASSGHLDICCWLFEVGAAEDLRKATNAGRTPIDNACRKARLEVCKWMVLKGALVTDDDTGATDPAVVKRDLRNEGVVSNLRIWADGVVAANNIFRETVLRGTLVPDSLPTGTLLRRAYIANGLSEAAADVTIAALPEEQREIVLQQLQPQQTAVSPLTKLSGCAGPLELVADFVGGIERGQQLRNARELRDCLQASSDSLSDEVAPAGRLVGNTVGNMVHVNMVRERLQWATRTAAEAEPRTET